MVIGDDNHHVRIDFNSKLQLKQAERNLKKYSCGSDKRTTHDRVRTTLATSSSLPFITTNLMEAVDTLKVPTISMPNHKNRKNMKSKDRVEGGRVKHSMKYGEDHMTRRNVDELQCLVEKAAAQEAKYSYDDEYDDDFGIVLKTWNPPMYRGIQLVETQSYGLGQIFRQIWSHVEKRIERASANQQRLGQQLAASQLRLKELEMQNLQSDAKHERRSNLMQNQWESHVGSLTKSHDQTIKALECQLNAQKQLAHKSQETVAAFHTLFKQMKKEVENHQSTNSLQSHDSRLVKSLEDRIKSLNDTLEKERRIRKMQDESHHNNQRNSNPDLVASGKHYRMVDCPIVIPHIHSSNPVEPCTTSWLIQITRRIWSDRVIFEYVADMEGRSIPSFDSFVYASIQRMNMNDTTTIQFYRGIEQWKDTNHELLLFENSFYGRMNMECISFICIAIRTLQQCLILPPYDIDDLIPIPLHHCIRIVHCLVFIFEHEKCRSQLIHNLQRQSVDNTIPLWIAINIFLDEYRRIAMDRDRQIESAFHLAIRTRDVNNDDTDNGLNFNDYIQLIRSLNMVHATDVECAEIYRIATIIGYGRVNGQSFLRAAHSHTIYQIFRKPITSVPVYVARIHHIEIALFKEIATQCALNPFELPKPLTKFAKSSLLSQDRMNELRIQTEFALDFAQLSSKSHVNTSSQSNGFGQLCLHRYLQLAAHLCILRLCSDSGNKNNDSGNYMSNIDKQIRQWSELVLDDIAKLQRDRRDYSKMLIAVKRISANWSLRCRKSHDLWNNLGIPRSLSKFYRLSQLKEVQTHTTIYDIQYLYSTISQLLWIRMKTRRSDCVDLTTSFDFAQFCFDYFIGRFGTIAICKVKASQFFKTLYTYFKQTHHPRLQFISRMLGINSSSSYDSSEIADFIIDSLSVIHHFQIPRTSVNVFQDTNMGIGTIMKDQCIDVIHSIYSFTNEYVEYAVNGRDRLMNALNLLVSPFNLVNIDQFMLMLMDQWMIERRQRMDRAQLYFEKQKHECDMEYELRIQRLHYFDDFSVFVLHINPFFKQSQLIRMHRIAIQRKSFTKDSFYILGEQFKLFSSSIQMPYNNSNDMDHNNNYIFDWALLLDTWNIDYAFVLTTLENLRQYASKDLRPLIPLENAFEQMKTIIRKNGNLTESSVHGSIVNQGWATYRHIFQHIDTLSQFYRFNDSTPSSTST